MKNYTITVNGIAYEVTVEEGTGSSTKAAAPVVMPVAAPVAPKTVAPTPVAKEEPKAEEAAPKAAAPGGSAGSVKVNAPMPGKILAIKASIGQSMKRGDVLLILEAMKMENEIVAPEDGILASINVTVGDMVEAGVLLATMNK